MSGTKSYWLRKACFLRRIWNKLPSTHPWSVPACLRRTQGSRWTPRNMGPWPGGSGGSFSTTDRACGPLQVRKAVWDIARLSRVIMWFISTPQSLVSMSSRKISQKGEFQLTPNHWAPSIAPRNWWLIPVLWGFPAEGRDPMTHPWFLKRKKEAFHTGQSIHQHSVMLNTGQIMQITVHISFECTSLWGVGIFLE